MVVLKGKQDNFIFDPADKTSVLKSNGRFALVYRGKAERMGQDVIIKQLHPRLLNNPAEIERFVNEYHPDWNFDFSSRTLDLIRQDNHLYLVREFIPGVELSYFVKEKLFVKIRRSELLKPFLISLLEPVAKLHNEGIIHGDLKPQNFIIRSSGNALPEVKIIDLGLAIKKNQDLKKEEVLPFSFIYSAPEIMLNAQHLVDERADIFSLGVIIYELLCGQTPWKEDHPAATMNLQLVYPLPEHRKLSEEILQLLNKASAKYAFATVPNRISKTEQEKGLSQAIGQRFFSVSEMMLAIEKCPSVIRTKKWKLF